MEIIINETADLLTVAAILVKNGTRSGKARSAERKGRTPGGKS